MPNMIQEHFIIDPKKKEIRLKSKIGPKTYTVQALYSYLMDVFDEPEFMRYDIPMEAVSKSEFKLINGWRVESEVLKTLKGGILKT